MTSHTILKIPSGINSLCSISHPNCKQNRSCLDLLINLAWTLSCFAGLSSSFTSSSNAETLILVPRLKGEDSKSFFMWVIYKTALNSQRLDLFIVTARYWLCGRLFSETVIINVVVLWQIIWWWCVLVCIIIWYYIIILLFFFYSLQQQQPRQKKKHFFLIETTTTSSYFILLVKIMNYCYLLVVARC